MENNRKHIPIICGIIALLLVLYLVFAAVSGIFPFSGREAEPVPEPVVKTAEERYKEFLQIFVDDEEMLDALLDAELNDADAAFSFREKEVTVICKEEDESLSGDNGKAVLWLSIGDADPRLVCLNVTNMDKGSPDDESERGIKYVYNGDTYLGTLRDSYDGYDPDGLCNWLIGPTWRFGNSLHTVQFDTDEIGDYIIEDGFYRITIGHLKGEGLIAVSPELLFPREEENADSGFALSVTWSDGREMKDKMCVVAFMLESSSDPGGKGGHGGGTDPKPGTDPSPTPPPNDSHECSNKPGCTRATVHCRWCNQWHCLTHICEKRWAYNFWIMNTVGGYDQSAYQRAHEHFVNGTGASNYKKWLPDFEAFGVQYNYD